MGDHDSYSDCWFVGSLGVLRLSGLPTSPCGPKKMIGRQSTLVDRLPRFHWVQALPPVAARFFRRTPYRPQRGASLELWELGAAPRRDRHHARHEGET